MQNGLFISTPIYYVNARPHLGHAYTTIAADVRARFARMQGKETFFLTGTDEHGDKIVKAAEAEGKQAKEYADEISSAFKDLWPKLHIANDYFIRTTDPSHIEVVQYLLQKIYDKGDIYFSEYEGLYCYGCERFYTEKELVDGKCPDHLVAPEKIKESNYFFKMSSYQDWLINHIKENPDFIRPERYKNEILAFLREPLEDLCISRPKSRLKWGITLPFDDNFVTYVWFDALTNYISALSYPHGEKFKKLWPHAQHIVAKDIIKPHGIYWPCMLKAADIPLYKHLNVHGYWNISETKMSKSLGNIVKPEEMISTYGVDAFRYFLMREMVFGLDASFSEEALINRINADLANDLGNLFSRVIAMLHKYYKGKVPENNVSSEDILSRELADEAIKTLDLLQREIENFAFHKGLIAVWEYISKLNKYIDSNAPWELHKNNEEAKLNAVIYNLLEALRIVTGLIHPFMPETSFKMQENLGLDEDKINNTEKLKIWGLMPSGHTLAKPCALFPRIEVKKEDKKEPVSKAKKKSKDLISIKDIEKLDLRIARIIEAEKVDESERLLKLIVDLGKEKRQVIAGIAKSYKAEELIGKQIVLVANLQSAEFMGLESQGMILAAKDKNGLCLAGFDREVKDGSPVK